MLSKSQNISTLDCNYTIIEPYAVPTNVCIHIDQMEVEIYQCLNGYLFRSYWNTTDDCDSSITPGTFNNVSSEYIFNCNSQNQCDYLLLERYLIDNINNCTDGVLPSTSVLWQSIASITGICIRGVITSSCDSSQISTVTIYNGQTCSGFILDQIVIPIGGECVAPDEYVRDSQCIITSPPTTDIPTTNAPASSLPTTLIPTTITPTTNVPTASMEPTASNTTTVAPTTNAPSSEVPTAAIEPTVSPLISSEEPTPVPTKMNETQPTYEPTYHPTTPWLTENKGKTKATEYVDVVQDIIQRQKGNGNNDKQGKEENNTTSALFMIPRVDRVESSSNSEQLLSMVIAVSLLLIVIILSFLTGIWIGSRFLKHDRN